MNKFIKVVLIIAAVCAGVGVLLCGVGTISGVSMMDVKSKLKIEEKNILGNSGTEAATENDYGFDHGLDAKPGNIFQKFAAWVEDAADAVSLNSDNYDGSWINGSNVTREDYSYDGSKVRNLDISLYAGSLTLEESDTGDVRVTVYYKNAAVNCDRNKETLKLKEEKKRYSRKHRVAVILYLPKDIRLKTLNIDAGAGQVTSDLDQLAAENAKIAVGAGEAVFDALKVTDRLEVTVQAGSIDLSDTYTKDLSLDCGVGELVYQGGTTGDLTGNSGVGSLELDLDGKPGDYNYSLSCGVGSIDIEDETYSGLGAEKDIDHDADKDMSLDCGVGSITVDFD